MPEIRNCPRCGRLFAFRGRDICPTCVSEEEEQFERVRRFLRSAPAASLGDIVEATGVSAELILSFLRQGRLLAGDGLKGMLTCQRCGTPIDEGYLCADCSREVAREMGRVAEAGQHEEREETRVPEEEGRRGRGRMYVADLVKRWRQQDDKPL